MIIDHTHIASKFIIRKSRYLPSSSAVCVQAGRPFSAGWHTRFSHCLLFNPTDAKSTVYDYTTDKGAAVLNDYARLNDSFARIGKESVTVQITSVVRASETSLNVRWTQRRFVNGAAAGLERWTSIVSIVHQTPRTEERLRKNPLGLYVNGLSWSHELNTAEGIKL